MIASLTALTINCTLKPSPADSSTAVLQGQLSTFLRERSVAGEDVRAVDFAIAPGVEKDMGDGDEWPMLRQKVLAADIVVLLTPTWLGEDLSSTPEAVRASITTALTNAIRLAGALRNEGYPPTG